jgi:hypothetical protein
VEIGAEEVIVGQYPYRHLSAEEQAALQAAQQ